MELSILTSDMQALALWQVKLQYHVMFTETATGKATMVLCGLIDVMP
jgi:hypothetical protein